MEGKLLPFFMHKKEDPQWNHCWFTCSQTNGTCSCASCPSALWQSNTRHTKCWSKEKPPSILQVLPFGPGLQHDAFCNNFFKVHTYWWIHLPYWKTVWHKSCWGSSGTMCSAGVLQTLWATPAQHQSRDPCLTADFQQSRREQVRK